MASSMRKGLLYGALLIAGVTLGMQLSENGMNETYSNNLTQGSQSGTIAAEQSTVSDTPTPRISLPEELDTVVYDDSVSTLNAGPEELLLPPPTGSAVDRLADKTAHLLQQASKQGIHWIASLFGPNAETTQE